MSKPTTSKAVAGAGKNRRKQSQFKTMYVGCPKRWTKEQQEAIDATLPGWHQFALVDHADLDGRDSVLVNKKKEISNKLLGLDAFKDLPTDVSLPRYTVDSLTNVLRWIFLKLERC